MSSMRLLWFHCKCNAFKGLLNVHKFKIDIIPRPRLEGELRNLLNIAQSLKMAATWWPCPSLKIKTKAPKKKDKEGGGP